MLRIKENSVEDNLIFSKNTNKEMTPVFIFSLLIIYCLTPTRLHTCNTYLLNFLLAHLHLPIPSCDRRLNAETATRLFPFSVFQVCCMVTIFASKSHWYEYTSIANFENKAHKFPTLAHPSERV